MKQEGLPELRWMKSDGSARDLQQILADALAQPDPGVIQTATHAGTIEDFLRRREFGIWTAADTAHILGHIRLVEAAWKALVEEYARL